MQPGTSPPRRTSHASRARQARLCLALSAGVDSLLAAAPAAVLAWSGEDGGDGYGYAEVAVDDVRYVTRAVGGGYVQVTEAAEGYAGWRQCTRDASL